MVKVSKSKLSYGHDLCEYGLARVDSPHRTNISSLPTSLSINRPFQDKIDISPIYMIYAAHHAAGWEPYSLFGLWRASLDVSIFVHILRNTSYWQVRIWTVHVLYTYTSLVRGLA